MQIRIVTPAEHETLLPSLIEVLRDSVESGASVGFDEWMGAAVEPRGRRPEPRRKDGKGKHPVGPRGRPGNIRHQGRKR